MRVLIETPPSTGALEGAARSSPGHGDRRGPGHERGHALSDQRDLEDYIDMVLRNAKMLSGVELTVGAIRRRKGRILPGCPDQTRPCRGAGRQTRPDTDSLLVWQGIDAVRLSGLTNMLDRPVVARLRGRISDAASWIEEHRRIRRGRLPRVHRRSAGEILMCGLAGVIFGNKRRRAETGHLAWLLPACLY